MSMGGEAKFDRVLHTALYNFGNECFDFSFGIVHINVTVFSEDGDTIWSLVLIILMLTVLVMSTMVMVMMLVARTKTWIGRIDICLNDPSGTNWFPIGVHMIAQTACISQRIIYSCISILLQSFFRNFNTTFRMIVTTSAVTTGGFRTAATFSLGGTARRRSRRRGRSNSGDRSLVFLIRLLFRRGLLLLILTAATRRIAARFFVLKFERITIIPLCQTVMSMIGMFTTRLFLLMFIFFLLLILFAAAARRTTARMLTLVFQVVLLLKI